MKAVPGITRFQLIDEDGDDLPGSWEFAWEGRDPFDAVVATVTEVSGRPWKWSSRHNHSGRLSPARCRTLSVRVGNVLRGVNLPEASAVLSRVVADEYEIRAHRVIDPTTVLAALANKKPLTDDLDAPPEIIAATMLRAFRQALRAAVECDGGLRVFWQVG